MLLYAKPAFDAVEEKVSSVGSRMSLYVDDITLSGPSATNGCWRKFDKLFGDMA